MRKSSDESLSNLSNIAILNQKVVIGKTEIWQPVISIIIWYIFKGMCLKVFQNLTIKACFDKHQYLDKDRV